MSKHSQYEVLNSGFEVINRVDEIIRPRLGIDWNFASPATIKVVSNSARKKYFWPEPEALENRFKELLLYLKSNNFCLDICFAEGGVFAEQYFWKYIESLRIEDHADVITRLEFRCQLASLGAEALEMTRRLGTANCFLEFDLRETDQPGWFDQLARKIDQINNAGILASPVGLVSADTKNRVITLIDQFVKHRIHRVGFIFPEHIPDNSDNKLNWMDYVCLRAIERLFYWRHTGHYIEWCGEHHLYAKILSRLGLNDIHDTQAIPFLGRQRLRLVDDGEFMFFQPPWIQLGYASSSTINEILKDARRRIEALNRNRP